MTTQKLNAGTAFPQMTLSLVDGGSVTLPDDIQSCYQIVLFYRAHW